MRPIFCFFSFDIYAICPSKFCHSFENFANHNNKQYFIYLYVSHLVTNIIEINVTIKLSQQNEEKKNENSDRTRSERADRSAYKVHTKLNKHDKQTKNAKEGYFNGKRTNNELSFAFTLLNIHSHLNVYTKK